MIEESHGNLLMAEVDAIVNTVNTVGVMGKGIALQFKRAFPANFRAYRAACERERRSPADRAGVPADGRRPLCDLSA